MTSKFFPSDFSFLYYSANYGVNYLHGPHQWAEKYNPTISLLLRSSRDITESLSWVTNLAPSKNLRPPSLRLWLNFSNFSYLFFDSDFNASSDQGNPYYLFS